MKKSNFLCLISVLIGTNTACFAENLFDVNRTNLTGDWDGKRTALADKGIKFDASSNLDIAYLADGGYAPRQDLMCAEKTGHFDLGDSMQPI